MRLCASVYMCLVVTCWERADLLALVCGEFGILGQVWYLIVSIPDLCTLTYLNRIDIIQSELQQFDVIPVTETW